jgi:hypothetical protein
MGRRRPWSLYPPSPRTVSDAAAGAFEIPRFPDASCARGIEPSSLSNNTFLPSLTYHYTNTIYSTLLSFTAFIYITYLHSLCCFDILCHFYWIFIGVNVWLKLQIQLVAAIKGFNRSRLSCKKKYKSILADYKNDKMANGVSCADRYQECM